jgi:hypothetical protein
VNMQMEKKLYGEQYRCKKRHDKCEKHKVFHQFKVKFQGKDLLWDYSLVRSGYTFQRS